MTTQTIAHLFDLAGSGAIVTGGAMGIGMAIAFRLAEAGASVMIADTDLEAATQTAEHIKAQGGRAHAIRADAGSTTDAKKTVQVTVETFGRVDVLVNNAGVYPFSPALEISEEMWDRVLSINLKGVFFYSQAAAKEMIRAGHGGKIINLASKDAMRPQLGLAHYAASKGGVVALTRALALELAPHNILVNAIAPGNVKTPGTRATGAALQASGKLTEERLKDLVRLPLGHTGKPDDVANVALVLASAAANYVTGSLIVVDGGFLLS